VPGNDPWPIQVNHSFNDDHESRRTAGVWHVLNRLLITIIVLILISAGALAFIPLFQQRNEQTSRIEQLQGEITKQKALLTRRTRETELLKNDPTYNETLARDSLEMMKPGETIIRLEPAGSPAPVAAKVKE